MFSNDPASPKMSGDKLVVSASYVATTVRFLPDAAQQKPEQGTKTAERTQ